MFLSRSVAKAVIKPNRNTENNWDDGRNAMKMHINTGSKMEIVFEKFTSCEPLHCSSFFDLWAYLAVALFV